jgi:hypothetical protein
MMLTILWTALHKKLLELLEAEMEPVWIFDARYRYRAKPVRPD